ncbi:SMAD/FHA domain-containing protein [Ophiocordyceps camponoti-floridani]|uniref:SMAD/FHA domain-containing protein n=1 Tax=Ophiocordyceps camponoti-floridani TaxID=2030778 RepID=A0A8H4Q5B5_9HYPO|nr:SMAD/FHA domain-containing protein [Ophiocordyceps camponoti-floridani]
MVRSVKGTGPEAPKATKRVTWKDLRDRPRDGARDDDSDMYDVGDEGRRERTSYRGRRECSRRERHRREDVDSYADDTESTRRERSRYRREDVESYVDGRRSNRRERTRHGREDVDSYADGRRSHRRERSRHGREDEDRPRRHSRDERYRMEHRTPLASQQESFAIVRGDASGDSTQPKEKPNLASTGTLAAASNSVTQDDGSSTTLKYHEPAEARTPPSRDQWRLFVFRDGEVIDEIALSLKSCWLVGRQAAVVDVLTPNPTASKQHAVIQFRHVETSNKYGDQVGETKPYLIDLESTHGTVLNGEAVPTGRYVELRSQDMFVFGSSKREYVIMLAPHDD